MLEPKFTLDDIERGFLDVGEEKAILYLKIPGAISKGSFPIIVYNDQWQPDEHHRIRGRVIGLYNRHGAENDALTAEKIQHYIT